MFITGNKTLRKNCAIMTLIKESAFVNKANEYIMVTYTEYINLSIVLRNMMQASLRSSYMCGIHLTIL